MRFAVHVRHKGSIKPATGCLLLLFVSHLGAQQQITVTASCNNPPAAVANTPYRHTLAFTEAGVTTGWTRQAVSWSLLSRSDAQLSLATNGALGGTFQAGPVSFQARVSVTYQYCEVQSTVCPPNYGITRLVDSAAISCTIPVQSVPPRINDVQPRSATVCGPGVSLQISATSLFPGFQAGIGSRQTQEITQLGLLGSSLTSSPQSATANLSAAILANPPFTDVENAGTFLANAPFTPESFSAGFAFTLRRTPILADYSPRALAAGVAAALTVSGQNLVPGVTQLRWEPAGRAAQVIAPRQGGSATQLIYDIPASLVAAQGSVANLTLVNREDSNPANAAYSCVRPLSITVGSAPLLLRSINPTAATACGPGFSLSAVTEGLAAGGQLRWDGTALGNQIADATKQAISADVTAAQLGTTPRRVAVTVANPAASGGTAFGTPSSPLDFTISAAPAIGVPDITGAVRGSQDVTVRFSATNAIPNVTRIRWINGATSVLLPTQVSGTQVTATIGANLLTTAGTARLAVVNADAANPGGALPATGGNCPVERAFTISVPTITLSSSNVSSVAVASPDDVAVTLTGTGFATGSAVLVNGSTAGVTTTRVSAGTPGTIEATLAKTLFASLGTLDLSVRNPDGTASGTLPIAVVLPRAPQIALTANPLQPSAPTDQPSLVMAQSNPSTRLLEGTATLSFTPDPQVRNLQGTLPRQALPAFAATSGQELVFDVPTNATSVALPMNGRFSLPSIGGTVTVALTRLTVKGTTLSVLPESGPAPVNIAVRVSAPTIVATSGQQSVRFTNATTSGFVIELDGLATGRLIDRADFEFRVAAGVKVDSSTVIQVLVSSDFNSFFQSAAGLQSGSAFRLRVPFSIADGDANSIQGVTVTLRSTVGGDSSPVTGSR
ncbi:MAG: hypothetical protein IT168_27025 [Bryobacterales bacterium]|nr:hypothetical protein [Bryobacterales bacterium]